MEVGLVLGENQTVEVQVVLGLDLERRKLIPILNHLIPNNSILTRVVKGMCLKKITCLCTIWIFDWVLIHTFLLISYAPAAGPVSNQVEAGMIFSWSWKSPVYRSAHQMFSRITDHKCSKNWKKFCLLFVKVFPFVNNKLIGLKNWEYVHTFL